MRVRDWFPNCGHSFDVDRSERGRGRKSFLQVFVTDKKRLSHAVWLLAVVVGAAVAGVVAASLVGANLVFPIHVTSNSMGPYAHAGDYGVALYTRDIRRADVIAFHFPSGAPTLAMKRATILPGECMPPRGSGVGVSAVNPAVTAGMTCIVVPEGAVFVLGDNIGRSIDSRHFGAVTASEIVGRVVLVVPVSQWLARWRELTSSA